MPLCPVEWHAILLVKPGGGRGSRWPRLLPRPLCAHGEDSWPGGWTPFQGFSRGRGHTGLSVLSCAQVRLLPAVYTGHRRCQQGRHCLLRQPVLTMVVPAVLSLPLFKAAVVAEVRPAALLPSAFMTFHGLSNSYLVYNQACNTPRMNKERWRKALAARRRAASPLGSPSLAVHWLRRSPGRWRRGQEEATPPEVAAAAFSQSVDTAAQARLAGDPTLACYRLDDGQGSGVSVPREGGPQD